MSQALTVWNRPPSGVETSPSPEASMPGPVRECWEGCCLLSGGLESMVLAHPSFKGKSPQDGGFWWFCTWCSLRKWLSPTLKGTFVCMSLSSCPPPPRSPCGSRFVLLANPRRHSKRSACPPLHCLPSSSPPPAPASAVSSWVPVWPLIPWRDRHRLSHGHQGAGGRLSTTSFSF